MQAAIQQFARLGGFAAPHQRDQKRVFDHFALRVAAANPHGPGELASYGTLNAAHEGRPSTRAVARRPYTQAGALPRCHPASTRRIFLS